MTRVFAYIAMAWVFFLPHPWTFYLYQNFGYPKQIILDFLISFVALAFAFENEVRFPAKNLFFVSLGLLLLKLVSLMGHFNMITLYNTEDGIAFALLCLYFSTQKEKLKWDLKVFFWPMVVSFLGLCGYLCYFFTSYYLIQGKTDPLYYSVPFGNINLMTEYLIFTLPLLIYFLDVFRGWRSWLVQFIFTIFVFFVLMGQSRSTWIALVLCGGYGLFKRWSWREGASYGIAIVLFLAIKFLPGATPSIYQENKKESFIKRMALYNGTGKMLLDQPFGVGPGNFELNFFPYQMATSQPPTEEVIIDNPHSDILKAGAENGWLYFLLSICWWIMLGFAVWQIQGPLGSQIFFRGSFLVILPQLLFQFPFQSPASFLFLTFTFGLIFQAGKSISFKSKWWIRGLAFVLALALFSKAMNQTKAKWLEALATGNLYSAQRACAADPTNWHVCSLEILQMMDTPAIEAAFALAQKDLAMRPFNYFSLKARSIYYMKKSDTVKACENAIVYNTLFSGRSSLSNFVQESCQLVTNPVPFSDSSQFNRDYRNWVLAP